MSKIPHAYQEWPMSAEDTLIHGGMRCHVRLGLSVRGLASVWCERPRSEHRRPRAQKIITLCCGICRTVVLRGIMSEQIVPPGRLWIECKKCVDAQLSPEAGA
jgi:hypothetical protein